MHELSLTSQIVQTVLKEAKKQGAKKILEVHLIIGKFTLLGIEQVRFSFKMLVKDTIAEQSRLFIKHQQGKVKCEHCGYEGAIALKDALLHHVPIISLACPTCGSTTTIIEGHECLIKSVKLVI